MLFQDLPLSPEIRKAIEEMGYTAPTKIQADAITPLLEGKDVIGLSGTGTGKTAAYSIPVIEKISDGGVQVLILCPTRELAMQIAEEIRKFSKYKKGIRLATLYGGQAYPIQLAQLKIANIVIGTPGRLMDHLDRGTLSLHEMTTVVLDEADEMLNMGFFEDIEHILEQGPEERQTILFSATMPPSILRATKKFQTTPVLVEVEAPRGDDITIEQHCYDVPRGKKMEAINLLLQYHNPKRSVIFCNTKRMVDELVEYLNNHHFASEGLHGDMKQLQRTAVMRGYKLGKTKILVATDVAARGIDVEDVEAVFNFDIPLEREYYIHRIGRTGRAGKSGVSHTFVCDKSQRRKIMDIEHHTGQKLLDSELPTAKQIKRRRGEEHLEHIKTAIENRTEDYNEPVLDALLEAGCDLTQIANVALRAMLGEEKREIPSIPTIKRRATEGRSSEGRPARAFDNVVGNRVRVRVDVGRRHKVMPNFIVGAFVEGSDLTPNRIGNIKICNDYSDVELTKEDALLAMPMLEGTKIRNKTISLTLLPPAAKEERKRPMKKPPRRKYENK
ncbi:MAG: DEAD/DEAH box helicase [Eubacteriales bacterium]